MTGIERPDWGPATAGHGGRETPGSADAVPATTDVKPDVKQVGEGAAGEGQENPVHPAAVDDVDDSALRKLLADGIFTREELGRHYGLNEEQLDTLSKPQPKPLSRRSIDKELADIDKARRTDRTAYFKDDALQQRELELLAAKEKLSEEAAAEEEAGEADVSGLDPELVAAWEKEGGVDVNLATARSTAQTALDELDGDEQAALTESFDALPASAQTSIYKYIAIEPGNWRAADEAAVEAFASMPEGKELIEQWGDKAAKNVGITQGRINMMLQSMPPADRDRAEAWFDALTPAQAKAVLRSLVGQ